VAFFFACVLDRHKKVGVLADLVLVSTCERRCEGWRSHLRAIRDDSRVILGAFLMGGCDELHISLSTKEKGADWRP
jgi:hypothetical protein